MANIRLESSDGVIFETDEQIGKFSLTIRTLLEHTDNDENVVIPLKMVSSAILRKILEWTSYHKDDPMPLDLRKRSDEAIAWDANFVKMEQKTLFELILAANYLEAEALLDLTCKAVSNMMIGKTTEELREIFHIKNDFTPAEEENVRRESEWCEEK